MLRLAQGRVDVADATIRRALGEADDPITRARILGPYVEIVLASGDVEAARTAADELAAVAGVLNQPLLHAIADHVNGMVLLAEEHPSGADVAPPGVARLARPRGAARGRPGTGAHRRRLPRAGRRRQRRHGARRRPLGVHRAGAAPDLAWVRSLSGAPPGVFPDGLTAREVEVLALVAQGHTNRQIAELLFISEKTVASHLSHMFTKLGLSTRAAATAYAYEHGLT